MALIDGFPRCLFCSGGVSVPVPVASVMIVAGGGDDAGFKHPVDIICFKAEEKQSTGAGAGTGTDNDNGTTTVMFVGYSTTTTSRAGIFRLSIPPPPPPPTGTGTGTGGVVIPLNVKSTLTAAYEFCNPMVICRDPSPIRPDRYYIGDKSYLVCVDFSAGGAGVGGYDQPGVVTRVAGGGKESEGEGDSIRIWYMIAMIITRAGDTAYFIDSEDELRSIDLNTRHVTVVKPNDFACSICWDRSRKDEGESGFLSAGLPGVSRFDLRTRKATAVKLRVIQPEGTEPDPDDPDGVDTLFFQAIVCTTSGAIIVSCTKTKRMYAGHIITTNNTSGELELCCNLMPITGAGAGAGTGTGTDTGTGTGADTGQPAVAGGNAFHPRALCVDERNQCAYVCDQNSSHVQCVTLSPHLFFPPHSL